MHVVSVRVCALKADKGAGDATRADYTAAKQTTMRENDGGGGHGGKRKEGRGVSYVSEKRDVEFADFTHGAGNISGNCAG